MRKKFVLAMFFIFVETQTNKKECLIQNQDNNNNIKNKKQLEIILKVSIFSI